MERKKHTTDSVNSAHPQCDTREAAVKMAGKSDSGGRKSQKHSESNDDVVVENGNMDEPDFNDPENFHDNISDEGNAVEN